jgi:hypothetical protein
MPTIQVDLIEVKQRLGTDNVVFTAKQGDSIITREIDISEFDTWETFADWLINQEPQFVLLPEKEKSLSIEFHTEIIEDETVRILDSVIAT